MSAARVDASREVSVPVPILMPGGDEIRKRSPGATAQPRCSSAVVAASSSATGTQTASPDRPVAATPCAASASIR